MIGLRFGLTDRYARSLREVGRLFSVTRERIRQVEASALAKLRHPARLKQLAGFVEPDARATRHGPTRNGKAPVSDGPSRSG